ncbi:DUF2442 domain-containing protein [Tsuneonella rigui]
MRRLSPYSGEGIHWPQLDEDVGLAGLLRTDGPVVRP